jgi:hypothetical protein
MCPRRGVVVTNNKRWTQPTDEICNSEWISWVGEQPYIYQQALCSVLLYYGSHDTYISPQNGHATLRSGAGDKVQTGSEPPHRPFQWVMGLTSMQGPD